MAPRGCGVLVGLLVTMLASYATAAAWYESIAVSNLGSGGQILFITANSKNLYLYKGLNAQPVLGSTVPKPQQALKASSGYPNAAFTLQIQGMAVVASGSAVTLSKTATTQWTIDSFYRVSADKYVTCLDVTSVDSNAKLVLKPCNTKASQQWNFLPAISPPNGIKGGLIQSLDESSPSKMCLTEGPPADPSTPMIKSVSLAPCTGAASQKLTSSGERTNNQNFNTGVFELHFEGSGNCLHVFCPGCGDGAPRETATLVSAACSNEFPDGFYYRWYYNSRAQLQSDAVAGEHGVPICMDIQAGVSITGTCSYKLASNRWGISAPAW